MDSHIRHGNSPATSIHVAGPVAVGRFIAPIAGKTLNRGGTAMAGLISQWPAIAGPALAGYTMPAKMTKTGSGPATSVSNGPSVLLLKVDPAKALDVQYATPQLIERINQVLGYQAVAALRLIQTPIQGRPNQKPRKPDPLARPETATGAGRLRNALSRMAASRYSRKNS